MTRVRVAGYAACLWSVRFAAPHAWWALGIPAGFPGGEASYHRFMGSAWRYWYDVAVVVLCVVAIRITFRLVRAVEPVARHRGLRGALWLASGALTLRGVAGLVVDGASDPVWWPMFLTGGILFGSVARLTAAPHTMHRRA